ncbi:MAG: hypothetical protein ACR2PZ_23480 [Pseudomonadales bacterium]
MTRPGRRVAHIWIDQANGQSVLDWFRTEYVLLLGETEKAERWMDAVARLQQSFPINVRQIQVQDAEPHTRDGLVLVRPNGIITDA